MVQNLQYKFLDWKWLAPPLELFRKLIRFGGATRPYVIPKLSAICPLEVPKLFQNILKVVLKISPSGSQFVATLSSSHVLRQKWEMQIEFLKVAQEKS